VKNSRYVFRAPEGRFALFAVSFILQVRV